MTVERLIDRLAHVPDKTKPVIASCGAFCLPVHGVEDTKGGVLFLELEDMHDD